MQNSNSRSLIDLSIFVPCYNESKLVSQTLDDIRQALASTDLTWEILIYDDASTDNTAETVKTYIKEHNLSGNVSLISCETNQGVGINYFRAAETAKGSYFIGIAGDNGEPVETIRRIFQLIGRADVIIPHFDTRLFDMAFNGDHRPFKRRLLSILYAKMVRHISGHSLHYFNACMLYRRELILKHRVVTLGLGYNAELLCRVLNEPDITYLEIKVDNKDRAYGTTTAFRPKNVAAVCASLVRIFKYCRLSKHKKIAQKDSSASITAAAHNTQD